MKWKLLTFAFKDDYGEMFFMEFVVMEFNGEAKEITNDCVVSSDELGRDRAALEGLEFVGCRLDDLKEMQGD